MTDAILSKVARENRVLGITALNEAIARVEGALTSADGQAFFASVAESLFWIALVDETLWEIPGYEDARSKTADGHVIQALRYTRNRQVHDWQITGLQGNPLLAENPRMPETWRDLADPEIASRYKPTKRDRPGEEIYRDTMVGEPVLPALLRAAEFLTIAVSKWGSDERI